MSEVLIDKARALGHADAEIARRIGVPRSNFADVAHGRRKMPPEWAALLAELVGEDPRMALAAQTVERAKGSMRERLQQALFRARERGAASVLLLVALAAGTVAATMCKRLSAADGFNKRHA